MLSGCSECCPVSERCSTAASVQDRHSLRMVSFTVARGASRVLDVLTQDLRAFDHQRSGLARKFCWARGYTLMYFTTMLQRLLTAVLVIGGNQCSCLELSQHGILYTAGPLSVLQLGSGCSFSQGSSQVTRIRGAWLCITSCERLALTSYPACLVCHVDSSRRSVGARCEVNLDWVQHPHLALFARL